MLRPLKSIAVACLRSIWGSAMTYGKLLLAVPELSDAEPGGLHPERVRHDVPLSRTEKALERQIRDLT